MDGVGTSCRERTCAYTLAKLSRAHPLWARMTPTLHRHCLHLFELSPILDVVAFRDENTDSFGNLAALPPLGSIRLIKSLFRIHVIAEAPRKAAAMTSPA